MDTTTHHPLRDLFDQLGLPSTEADIQRFVREHGSLPAGQRLTDAPFWTESQASFLREEWRADDGDWALAVDQLNALMHVQPDVAARADGAPAD